MRKPNVETRAIIIHGIGFGEWEEKGNPSLIYPALPTFIFRRYVLVNYESFVPGIKNLARAKLVKHAGGFLA